MSPHVSTDFTLTCTCGGRSQHAAAALAAYNITVMSRCNVARAAPSRFPRYGCLPPAPLPPTRIPSTSLPMGAQSAALPLLTAIHEDEEAAWLAIDLAACLDATVFWASPRSGLSVHVSAIRGCKREGKWCDPASSCVGYTSAGCGGRFPPSLLLNGSTEKPYVCSKAQRPPNKAASCTSPSTRPQPAGLSNATAVTIAFAIAIATAVNPGGAQIPKLRLGAMASHFEGHAGPRRNRSKGVASALPLAHNRGARRTFRVTHPDGRRSMHRVGDATFTLPAASARPPATVR